MFQENIWFLVLKHEASNHFVNFRVDQTTILYDLVALRLGKDIQSPEIAFRFTPKADIVVAITDFRLWPKATFLNSEVHRCSVRSWERCPNSDSQGDLGYQRLTRKWVQVILSILPENRRCEHYLLVIAFERLAA